MNFLTRKCFALEEGAVSNETYNIGYGLRSLSHLREHPTARADDSHAAAVIPSLRIASCFQVVKTVPCQNLVRSFALSRIEPHAPPVVRVPVNSFEF